MSCRESMTLKARLRLLLPVIALVLLGGCAGPNEAVQRARASYEAARNDPDIARNAPVLLSKAGETLRHAERADKREDANHLAYIAGQQVEVARASASRQAAESSAQQALAGRDKILLEQRNREVQELREKVAEYKAQQTDRGIMLTLGGVLFETDRSVLKPGARQNLEQLARYLESRPDQQILIEGHTDSQGSHEYNADLSARRAQAVADFLIGHGIDARRVVTRGYGETYPVASNALPSGRLQNRRVEIYLPDTGRGVAMRER